jgi:ribose/xylose/arabinose/galactoside ABC-type transport system permease subunit
MPAREEARAPLARHANTIALRVVALGPLLILGALWVVLSFLSPYFFTTLNFTNLLQASSVVAILAVGQLLIVLTGQIDLSAGSVVALTTVVGAKLAQSTLHSGLLVIAAMAATGCAVGLANGLLIEKAKLGSSFVITLGMLSIANGLAYVVSDGSTITGLPKLIDDIGSQDVGGLPISALVVVGVAALAAVLSGRLRWGRWIYAVGGNRAAAERVGIPVRAVSISVFVFGGLAAGLAGVIQAGLTDSGAASAGFNSELDAISAVVIGGAALTGGRGTVFGTLVGALILGTIHNGLNILSINLNWEPVVLGSVLILAIGADRLRESFETRLRLRGSADEQRGTHDERAMGALERTAA